MVILYGPVCYSDYLFTVVSDDIILVSRQNRFLQLKRNSTGTIDSTSNSAARMVSLFLFICFSGYLQYTPKEILYI